MGHRTRGFPQRNASCYQYTIFLVLQVDVEYQVIVAVNVNLNEEELIGTQGSEGISVETKSRLLQEYRDSLRFLDDINAYRREKTRPTVKLTTLSLFGLLQKYKALPSTENVKHLNFVSRTISFWEISLNSNGWMPKAKPSIEDVVQAQLGTIEINSKKVRQQMNKESGFDGNISPHWLLQELSSCISSDNEMVKIIRRHRQHYLLNLFMEWYALVERSSFVLDNLISKIREEDGNKHTILCIDEFNSRYCSLLKESSNTMIFDNVTILLGFSYLSSPDHIDIDHPAFLQWNLPIKYRISHDSEHLVIQSVKNNSTRNDFLKSHIENFHIYLPMGKKPIWISVQREDEINTDALQEYFNGLKDADVLVTSNKYLPQNYLDYFNEKRWTYVRPSEIIGSETTMLICLRMPILHDFSDIVSRAKKGLIIVTKEGDKDEKRLLW